MTVEFILRKRGLSIKAFVKNQPFVYIKKGNLNEIPFFIIIKKSIITL